MATYAKQVDFLNNPQFDPTTNLRYSDGYAKVLLAGTSTLATIYSARDKSGTLTNPVQLDSDDTKEMFLDGVFDIELYEGDPASGGVKKDTIYGLDYTVVSGSDLASDTPTSGKLATWDGMPMIDARLYGAVGDGVTDDTAAIQAAIDANTSGTVFIPFDSVFTLGDLVIPDDFILYYKGSKFEIAKRADGENFYAPSGEGIFSRSADITDSEATGTGADYSTSDVYMAIKLTTSPDVSFIQGIKLRLKKSGSLTDGSNLNFALHADSGGSPGALISSGGQVFGAQLTTSYTEINAMVQNVTAAMTPSTVYWIVIVRSESGGSFVFDSEAGTGVVYEGTTLGTLSDTNSIVYHKIMARSAYGVHAVANQSHAVWGVSINGVGVRGDSTAHYAIFGQSTADDAIRGNSTHQSGVYGSSTNGPGVRGRTSSVANYGIIGENSAASGGYPGVYGISESGPGIIADTNSEVIRTGTLRLLTGGETGGLKIVNQHISNGTAAPTTGTWTRGDIVFNTEPSAGGFVGWVNTATGIPGIWKGFGAIEA